MEIYQVKLGDSLTAIARTVLGDQSAWRKIAQLNNIPSPYIIRPGQQLMMPDVTVPGPVVVQADAIGPPAPAPRFAAAGFDLRDITPTTWLYLGAGALLLFAILDPKK